MKSITVVTMAEAQAQLSRLLQMVEAGEAVVIVNKRNRQTFNITPYQQAGDARKIRSQSSS